jgi:hypothetical protein
MTMSLTVIKVMQDCSSGYASVNGLKMYYEIHGTGLPLVLIHGGGATIQTSFGRVLHSFAREATSAGPPKPYE